MKTEDKASYEAPTLVVYGDVLELTAGGTSGVRNEGNRNCQSNANMNRKCNP